MTSLANISFVDGGTYPPTGGTALASAPDGQDLNRYDSVLDTGAAIGSDSNVSFTRNRPQTNATSPNGQTQLRRKVRIKVPFDTDANRNGAVNTIEIIVATDPQMTDSEVGTLLEYGKMCLTSADAADFWTNGSPS